MIHFVSVISTLFALLLLAGSALMAMMAMATPQGEPSISPIAIFLCVFGFGALLASGFLYASLLGDRMAASRRHRTVATALLAVPIGLGATLLLSGHARAWMPALALAAPAGLVLACLVWGRQATAGEA